jgi:multicomponent K+:H+ antiporter subunit F
MIELALTFTLSAIAVSLMLNLYRLLVGPAPTDRALALDTMVINSIGLIVLMGIWFATTMYFEAALLFAMVGFLTTVAFCKYFLRGNVIE